PAATSARFQREEQTTAPTNLTSPIRIPPDRIRRSRSLSKQSLRSSDAAGADRARDASGSGTDLKKGERQLALHLRGKLLVKFGDFRAHNECAIRLKRVSSEIFLVIILGDVEYFGGYHLRNDRPWEGFLPR